MIPIRPVSEYKAISWGQAKELSLNNIEIGAHTKNHPSLGKVVIDQLESEIIGSVNDIENNIGVRPLSFCYPNGQPDDYNENVKDFVRTAGCRGAVTAFNDENVLDDLYELR